MNEPAFSDEINAPVINIPRAALLFAREIAYPDLDIASYLIKLDDIAEAASKYTSLPSTITEKAESLSDVLFTQLGFRGNSQGYADPRNSYLNDVLDRRLGIPISLSVVFIAVAQKLGIPAQGVGLPGHFVVLIEDPDGGVYLDPFHGGTRLSIDDCAQLVRTTTGYAGPFQKDWLQPVTPLAVLTRMLNNLRNIYLQGENWSYALRVVEHLRMAQPNHLELLRDLGIIHHRSGSLRLAVRYYERYLLGSPEAEDAKAIIGYLQAAAQKLARLN
jgi:regulator of sirC expression with transglutaminase-like and TPR domain